MATIGQNSPYDEENPQQNLSSSSGLATPSLGGPVPAATSQNPRKGSGLFTNLNKYLEVNKGAGQQMGQKIQNTMESQIGQSQQQAQNAYNQGQGYIQPAAQKFNQGNELLGKLQNNGVSAQSLVGNAQQVQDFRQRNMFDEAQAQAANQAAFNAQQQAKSQTQDSLNNIGSEQGRFDLLGQNFTGKGLAKKQYGLGQQRLDQLLFEADASNTVGNIQKALSQRQAENNSLGNNILTQGQVTQQFKNTEDDLAKKFDQSIADRVSGYKNLASSILAEKQKDQQTGKDLLLNTFRNGYSNSDVNKYIDPSILADKSLATYNMNPEELSSYFRSNDINQSNVLNRDQLNERNALAQLANIKGNDIVSVDDSQVGGYKNPFTFDKDRFVQASNMKQDEATNALGAASSVYQDYNKNRDQANNDALNAKYQLKELEALKNDPVKFIQAAQRMGISTSVGKKVGNSHASDSQINTYRDLTPGEILQNYNNEVAGKNAAAEKWQMSYGKNLDEVKKQYDQYGAALGSSTNGKVASSKTLGDLLKPKAPKIQPGENFRRLK